MDQNVNNKLLKHARSGKIDSIKQLLEPVKPDVNADGPTGFNVLCEAASEGHTQVVEYLIKMGADINRESKNDRFTALACAVHRGHLDTAKKLVELGANTDITVDGWWEPTDLLTLAVERRCSDMFEYILDDVLQIEGSCDNVMDDPRFSRALRRAAISDHVNAIYSLHYDFGADIESTAPDGSNAIILAILHRNHRTVEALIELGARLDVKRDGMNLMDLAIETRWPYTIDVLAEHAITTTRAAAKRYANSVDIRDLAENFLNFAVLWSASNGAQVDKGIEDNDTALIRVLKAGRNFDLACLLIRLGARTDLIVENKNLLDLAMEKFGQPMIEFLAKIESRATRHRLSISYLRDAPEWARHCTPAKRPKT